MSTKVLSVASDIFLKCKDLIKNNILVKSTVTICSIYIVREIYYFIYRRANKLPPGIILFTYYDWN